MNFVLTQYLGLQMNANQRSIFWVLTTELLHGVAPTPGVVLCKTICIILQTVRKAMRFHPFLADHRSHRLRLPSRILCTA